MALRQSDRGRILPFPKQVDTRELWPPAGSSLSIDAIDAEGNWVVSTEGRQFWLTGVRFTPA